jgi:large subunit ribosomal protein L34e
MPRKMNKLPGNRTSPIYKMRKVGFPRCANCGGILHGMPRMHPSGVRKIAKSKRSPSRAFGGFYCASCAREILREKAREMV